MATTSSDSAPVDPFRVGVRSRLVDEVTHRLRELILNHQLPAGSKLLQIELAERLGVSRTPLREAIRLLEHEGLVRVSNGNRTVEVSKPSNDEIRELYELREMVDGLAARLMAREGMTAEAQVLLSSSLAGMKDSILPLQGEKFFVTHLAFHTTIVEHCGNERLKSQLPLVRLTAASLRDEFPVLVRSGPKVTSTSAKKHAAGTIAEHRAIYDAIRSGDESASELAARCHIRHALDTYIYPAIKT